MTINSRLLNLAIVLVTASNSRGGMEISSERLFETTVFSSSGSVLAGVFLTEQGDTIRLGSTTFGGLDDRGEPCQLPVACPFIQRVRSNGKVTLFRYLPLRWIGTLFAADPQGYVWIEAYLGSGQQAKFDLAPGVVSNQSRYFAKIDIATGDVLFTTRLASGWLGTTAAKEARPQNMAVDREGGLWIGGSRAGIDLPVTRDAIQPWIYGGAASLRAGKFPAALLRIDASGSRITYATYLGDGIEGGDGVGAIVIDKESNIYVVGSRIWKIFRDGRLMWSTWLPPGATLAAALGPSGDLFVGGCTTSPSGFYTTEGAFQREIRHEPVRPSVVTVYPSFCYDGFVVRMSPKGEIIYSTLVGGATGNLVHYLAVNSRNEAFFAGFVDVPSKDITWSGLSRRIGRLTADGSALTFLNHYPPWINSATALFWTDGDEVSVGGLGTYYRVDGATNYFLAIDRLREKEALAPRIDDVSVSVTGSWESGARLTVRGEGLCPNPIAVVDGVEYPALAEADGTAFELNPVPAPRPDALFRGSGMAYYTMRLRCGENTSSVVNVPLQFRKP